MSERIVGRFLPPHRGHHWRIDRAGEGAEVCVRAAADDAIPAALRVDWLRERHPDAFVRIVDAGELPSSPFDPRSPVPVRSAELRRDPCAHWAHLEPPVRAWYARRVCVIGAESTGGTTLARALAAHYATGWVPEYGRDYGWDKQAQPSGLWWSAEFRHIAREQRRQEDFAARSANRVLIADTNELATHLWHRRYLGHDDAQLQAIAAQARCDLYLLTGDEIAYEHDGLREKPWERPQMHAWLVEALHAQPVPWIELRGTHEARMQAATAAIDALFADSAWRPHAR